jgi:uncharacterized membrane protein
MQNCQRTREKKNRKWEKTKRKNHLAVRSNRLWKVTGYNWRNTLTEFARTSGVLAGFCITFIALILSGKVADSFIGALTIKFSDVAILSFGISASLFIASSQFFLHAREHDVFGFSKEYEDKMRKTCEEENKDWNLVKEQQTKSCKFSEMLGRNFYNIAIFMMFIGLGLAIAPYNSLIAFLAAGLGIALEAWQALRRN